MLNSTKSKLNATEAFLKSVQFQLSISPQDETQHIKFIKNDFLDINTTCYFLNSVIFELIIKILWEINHNKECTFTHDLRKLFSELSEESQKFLQQNYSQFKTQVESAIDSVTGGVNENINYCDLDEALDINKKIVMNFKYEMTPSSKNSLFNNIVSTDKHLYTIPHTLCKGFFESLLNEIKSKS